MPEATLEVESRRETGKNAARRLRAAGRIPAVVYGGGKPPVPIQVDRKTLLELLKESGGENAVFKLQLAGTKEQRHTMIREMVVDPLSRQITHLDFQRVLMTEKVRVEVPIALVGTPVGVKTEGGIVDFVTRQVEVECLPGAIPAALELDISELHAGQHREAGDLQMPPGVELLEEKDRVLAAVAHSRIAEAVEAAEAEAAEETLIEAETEEPEVIGRAKEEGGEKAP